MTDERTTGEYLDFVMELRGLLAFHQQLGLDFYPFVLPEARKRGCGYAALRDSSPAATDSTTDNKESFLADNQRTTLSAADLERAIAGCRNCPRGGEGVNTLSGEGKEGALLFIVVEQASMQETDKGQLLREEDQALLEKMLAAIKVSTDKVFMAPLVKCASAAVTTTREERTSCLPFLEEQIASLRPRAVLVFGEAAAQALLRSEQPLFHLRGKVEMVRDVPVLATYHPAQLRMEPTLKQMAWQDLQVLQKVLAGRSS